jgi:hypothetical protein
MITAEGYHKYYTYHYPFFLKIHKNIHHNLFCFISSHTASFKPSIFLKEVAVAGPKPEIDDELRVMAERGGWTIKSYHERVEETSNDFL